MHQNLAQRQVRLNFHVSNSHMVHARIILRILVLSALTVGAGCNIVGPLAVIAAGPDKTDALFELDQNLNYVIVVDDLKSRVPRRSLREEISLAAEEALLSEGAVAKDKLIAGKAALRLSADEDQFGTPLSVAELGERLGADAVIYVAMERWTLSRDGGTFSPSVIGSVKVVNARDNQRIWPPGGGVGYRLVMEPNTKVNNVEIPSDLAQRAQAEQAVARQFGLALAQTFFSHETGKSAKR
jgi:hypothetical protein